MTIREKYCVNDTMKDGKSREEAESSERENKPTRAEEWLMDGKCEHDTTGGPARRLWCIDCRRRALAMERADREAGAGRGRNGEVSGANRTKEET